MSGFDHVFWLGGSPCSGKTSISTILTNRFNLCVYHVDDAFERQAKRFDSALHPVLTKWQASSWNQRWMQPIDNLVKDVVACYQEHLTLVLEDILSLPNHKPLLVEGTALLPRRIARLLPTRSRAIWLISSAEFQTKNYSQREWLRGILEQCDSPDVAFHNWMERDAKFAQWLAAEVNVLGMELIQVDGTQEIEDYALRVATHFQLSYDAPHT